MMSAIGVRFVVACGLCCGMAMACAAQTYTPPPPPLTTLPPCPADKDAKKRAKRKDCDPTVYPSETKAVKGKKVADDPVVAPSGGAAADKFPFPGEQPAAASSSAATSVAPSAAKKFPFPGESAGGDVDKPPLPVSPDPTAEKKASESPAAKKFPFPGGAEPPVPADSPGALTKPDESSSSSSSSGSASSSSDDGTTTQRPGRASAAKNPDDDDEEPPQLKDKGSEGKRSKKVIKPQTDTERVDEDLRVAKFYGQDGNFVGAYLRAKDAVKIQPEYPTAHFALGEAAERLKKKDEAVAEFQSYLKLAPDGEKAKAAEKALDELK